MRKLLSITLAVCIVMSCVYTGAVFAADTTYSWELLRATGFETATQSTTDTKYNAQAQSGTNQTVYAGDNIVFANAANRSNWHYLLSTATGKEIFVYTTPYSGDSYYEGSAIYMWEKDGGTTATEANSLFGTVGKRIRVSFDVAAYNVSGGTVEKAVLDFDAADRTGYNCNQYNHIDYGSATIDIAPEGETFNYQRVSVEFDYSNAVTQKGFVIRFLADADNTDKTSKVGFRIDNVMIEAGTSDANAKDKLEIKPVDGGHMVYSSSAEYLDNTAIIAEYANGVFHKMAKVTPNRGLYTGAVRGNTLKGFIWQDTDETLIPLTEATPEYENREFETYKTIDFAKSTYTGGGANGGFYENGVRIGYTLSSNQFPFESGATKTLLMQVAAGGNTGIHIANQLPEFTSADIGKMCKISIKVLPYDGNVKGSVLKGYLGTSNVANTFAYPTDYTEGDITVMETWANAEYSVLEHEFIVTEALLNNRSVVMWFTNTTTAAPLTFMVDDMTVMMEK